MQIGHSRQPIFIDDDDRLAWCEHLREASLVTRVDVHAYVLMDNHVHLVATPREAAAHLSVMMQSLGRRYVAGFNRRHGRSGTLWEGRFRAALVDPDERLLACMRYVDSHPQRSGIAANAGDFRWSSCAHHLGRRRDPIVIDPACYWALGNTPFEREGAYRSFLDEGVPVAEALAISSATRRGWPIAGDRARLAFAAQLGRDATPRQRGRPPRPAPTGA
jgi:putative transposase